MQIEINEVEQCKLSVHYIADAEEIFNKRGVVIDAFRKAPVPGFRPGKASVEAIKLHYKDQIEESLKRALAEDAYHNTLFEKKLKPHGAPRFSGAMLADGKFTCDFELFTKPDFELAPYKELEIPKPAEPHGVTEVAELMMQELRTHYGEVSSFSETDFIQKGDKVILDFEGTLEDGQKVDSMTATDHIMVVGSSPVPAFDDNLLGMKVDDTREFDMVGPPHGFPSLVGKIIHIKVTFKAGSKTTPVPLDDSLAQKLNKKDLNELRDFVTATASARLAHAQKLKLNEAVAHRLLDDNKVPVPGWMTLSEAQYLAFQSKVDWNTLPDQDKEKYLEMSEMNVKLSLILDRIREKEPQAAMTDQEVFEIIKKNLAATKATTSLDEVIKEMNRTGYLQVLFSRIRDEYAMDFVVKSVKVIE